jgi:putative PIN family toxin of toxin-antitoxin system
VPERVVFDTNIQISGLLWRGKPYQCLLLARAGLVEPVYCPPMLAELADKLRHTFGFAEDHVQAVLYDVRRTSTRVDIPGELRAIAADPDDDKFVECAVAAGATVIVSGDHHLLDLGQYENVHILSAAEFLNRFKEFAGDG